MFSIKINVNRSDIRAIKNLEEEFKTGLKRGLGLAARFLKSKIKNSFGTPGKPRNRSGNLRKSIEYRTKSYRRATITANTVYAGLQEFGGTINAKNKPYLVFNIGGKVFKKKSVVIPPRPYMEPTATENEEEIGRIVLDEAIKEMNRR